jgi:hypothetical protein
MLGAIRCSTVSDEEEDGGDQSNSLMFRKMDELDLSSDALFRARVLAVMQTLPAQDCIRQKDLLKACVCL